MPVLLKCASCKVSSWNSIPDIKACLQQSIHVLWNGKCPICGSDSSSGFVSELREKPDFDRTIYGNLGNSYSTSAVYTDGSMREDVYKFAHHHFREFVLRGYPEFFPKMLTGDSTQYVEEIWLMFKQMCDEDGIKFTINLQDIAVNLYYIETPRISKPVPCVVIKLTPPVTNTEAYFVAAVLLPAQSAEGDRHIRGGIETSFFALEAADSHENPTRTFLGEWVIDDSQPSGYQHINYGVGPHPDIEEFVECVARVTMLSQ